MQGFNWSLTCNFSLDKQNKTHKPNNVKFAKVFKSARFVKRIKNNHCQPAFSDNMSDDACTQTQGIALGYKAVERSRFI